MPRRGGVGEKDPSREVKRVQCPRSVEGSRQQGEIRLGESLSPPEQAHGDKEIGKKRTPEFRHRDRIRHGYDDSYGRDADRKIGGPRYLLASSHPGRGKESRDTKQVTRFGCALFLEMGAAGQCCVTQVSETPYPHTVMLSGHGPAAHP